MAPLSSLAIGLRTLRGLCSLLFRLDGKITVGLVSEGCVWQGMEGRGGEVKQVLCYAQYPPIIIGMKNHVLVLNSRHVWIIVVMPNRIMKRMAAPIDGLYWYAFHPVGGMLGVWLTFGRKRVCVKGV